MKSKKQQETSQSQFFITQKSNPALKTLSWGLNNRSRSRSNELKNSFIDDFQRRITRQFKSKILNQQSQESFDKSMTQSLKIKNDVTQRKNLYSNASTILTRSQKTPKLNNNIFNYGRKIYHPSITTADTYSNYDQYEDNYSNKTILGFNQQNFFLKESVNESQQSTVNYNNINYSINNSVSKSVSKNEKSSTSSSLSLTNNSESIIKQSDDKDRSQDEDHYVYKIGQILNKRYQIIKHLGDGTFGRVLEVKNLINKQIYAAKVIRAVERYTNSAKQEADVLYKLKKLDESNNYIVNIQDSFMEKDNFVMIFEKLGSSLYDFMKENSYLGYPIQIIQLIFKQILEQVNFLHQNRYTHTDLKPENILFVSDKKITTFNRDQVLKKCQIPGDFEQTFQDKNKMFIPSYGNIKLIDLGNVTHENEHHSTTINTRQYRAPEVILGCQKWDELSDLWSIGCIILEIYNGDLFFETHENYEHIAMIEKSVECIPYEMVVNANDELKKYFCFNQQKLTRKKQTFFDWPKNASSYKSIKKLNKMKTIDEIIDPSHFELADLLKSILRVDPQKRLNCIEALQHPFFQKNYGPLILKENYE